MKKILVSAAAVALLTLGLAAPAHAATTTAAATCYTAGIDPKAYSAGVGDALYQMVYSAPNASGCSTIASINRITGEQWANDFGSKFTAWNGATTTYQQFPGSPDVYAVTSWDATGRAVSAQKLSFNEWVKAGAPAPRVTQRIQGVDVIKYGSGDELFVKSSNASVKLTFATWARMGYPSYSLDYVSIDFFKYANSSVIYTGDVDYKEPLTFSTWAELGYPTPRTI